MDFLTTLPSELLDAVFSYLTTQDLVHLRGVNGRLYSDINSNASVIAKDIVTRERSRIQDVMTSRPSFKDLSLIQTLRLYSSTIGIPSPSPIDIEMHAGRLANWYRESNAKHVRGVRALSWERSASEVFVFYFYLSHMFQKPAYLLDQASPESRCRIATKTQTRIQPLLNEARAAVKAQNLKESTRLHVLATDTNSLSMPSPWQAPDALESAFRALQHEPLTGSSAPDTRHERSELQRISADVATACSSGTCSMFDTAVSGNPNAALEWALTQKAGLPAPGTQFWFTPRPSVQKLFENAIVRVREFARDPLLVAAVWECVDVRPT